MFFLYQQYIDILKSNILSVTLLDNIIEIMRFKSYCISYALLTYLYIYYLLDKLIITTNEFFYNFFFIFT